MYGIISPIRIIFIFLTNGKSYVIAKPYSEVKAVQRNKQDLPHSDSFAYPFGHYNNTTINILKELKYTNAMTTIPGYANIGDDPFQIKRFGIYQHTSFNELKQIILEKNNRQIEAVS